MIHWMKPRKFFLLLVISTMIISACNLPILINAQKQKSTEREAPATSNLFQKAGESRVKPAAFGEVVSIPGWDIKVEEFLRGADALAVLNTPDWQVDDLPEGYEYAIAKMFLRCTSFDENAHSLGISELFITGSDGIGYGDTMDSWPQPEFLFEDMYTAETTEGWVDAVIPVTLTDVELVLNVDTNDGRFIRFLELEKGASISVPKIPKANNVGKDQGAPALVGDEVITPDWTITLEEIKRGEEVETLLQTNNDYYESPAEGIERVMLHVNIEYHDEMEYPANLGYDNFYSTDENGVTTQTDWLMLPEVPKINWINAIVLPGASLDGWVVVSVPDGKVNQKVIFDPYRYNYEKQAENLRYFMID